jgi:hypothetical protein
MNGRMSELRDVQELAFRAGDGLEVSLLWRRADDRLVVRVVDAKRGEAFVVRARKDNALDVFHHPFAYASRQAELATAA